jgi:hypothetical protein
MDPVKLGYYKRYPNCFVIATHFVVTFILCQTTHSSVGQY